MNSIDFLADQNFFEADTILLSSASSKIAYATAVQFQHRSNIKVVGLTSAANLNFCQSLGCELHSFVHQHRLQSGVANGAMLSWCSGLLRIGNRSLIGWQTLMRLGCQLRLITDQRLYRIFIHKCYQARWIQKWAWCCHLKARVWTGKAVALLGFRGKPHQSPAEPPPSLLPASELSAEPLGCSALLALGKISAWVITSSLERFFSSSESSMGCSGFELKIFEIQSNMDISSF